MHTSTTPEPERSISTPNCLSSHAQKQRAFWRAFIRPLARRTRYRLGMAPPEQDPSSNSSSFSDAVLACTTSVLSARCSDLKGRAGTLAVAYRSHAINRNEHRPPFAATSPSVDATLEEHHFEPAPLADTRDQASASCVLTRST